MRTAKQLIGTSDTIGNRTQMEAGGDQTGANLRAEYHTIATRGYQRIVEENGVDRRNVGWIEVSRELFLEHRAKRGGQMRGQVNTTV
jgi:hypothetical protein